MRSPTERKVIDRSQVMVSIVPTTGSITLLNPLVPGTGYNQRIGRTVSNKSVYIRGQLQPGFDYTTSNVVPQQICRMIIFTDSQPNGAAPVMADLLDGSTGLPTIAQLNLNNRDRFTILKDKVYTFGPIAYTTGTGTGFAAAPQIHHFEIYKKLGLNTVFNAGSAGTIADINTGALYLAFFTDVATVNDLISHTFTSRVRFTDE